MIGGNKEGLIKLIAEAKTCFLERERARTGDVVKMHAMHYRRHSTHVTCQCIQLKLRVFGCTNPSEGLHQWQSTPLVLLSTL